MFRTLAFSVIILIMLTGCVHNTTPPLEDCEWGVGCHNVGQDVRLYSN